MYEPLWYGISLTLVELPFILLNCIVFVPFVYFLLGFLPDAGSFFYYFLMFGETITFYTVFGQALVYITPSQPVSLRRLILLQVSLHLELSAPHWVKCTYQSQATMCLQVAQILGGAMNFFFNLFNGYIITYPKIPAGWQWMNRVVPTTWIIEGYTCSQYEHDNGPFIGPNLQGTTVHKFVQDYFGFDYGLVYWCLLFVAAYIVFFRVSSIAALKYMSFYRR
jgi:ABC-2 type transporter